MTIEDMLGENFLAFLLLALGASLVVGNGLALLRPRQDPVSGELQRAPLGRSLIQITIGAVASVWALATIAT